MMESLHIFLLVLHVAGGMVALLAGLVPMFSRKGSQVHVKGGRVYLWSMCVAVASALPLAFMRNSLFLGTIGVFSGYLVYTGYRAGKRKSSAPESKVDLAVMWGTMAVSCVMIAAAVYVSFAIQGGWAKGLVLGIFGGFCFLLTMEDARFYRHPYGSSKKGWILVHISRFGGAYIATFTAFVVTNVSFLPDLMLWLGPSIVGGMILSRTTKYWRKKLKLP